MSDQTGDAPDLGPGHNRRTPDELLIRGAFGGDINAIVSAMKNGADINFLHPGLRVTALHLSVAANDLLQTRLLVERYGAEFMPDGFGRWPSVVAIEAAVDDELQDYIAEREEQFLARTRPQDLAQRPG
jgi:hypothetical protein